MMTDTAQRCMKSSISKGFTLIELMIVVAIVAILAAIAYPAYTNAILKGKRAEGRAALLGLMQQEERYFTQYNSYVSFSTSSDAVSSAAAVSPTPFSLTSGDNPSQAAYKLSATPCNGGASSTLNTCVVVLATPNAPGFNDPAYGVLTIQSSGAKGCQGQISNPVCWSGT